jgi:hypothetical protein
MFFIIKRCFLGRFGRRRPAVDDLRLLSPKSRSLAKLGALPCWQHKPAHSARRWGCGGTVVRFRANEIGVVGALAIAVVLGGCANVDENKDAWFSKPFEFVSRKGGFTFSELQESKARTLPITAKDLVAANGSCPAPAVPPAPAGAAANQPGSAPAATDTSGPRPGIYHFEAGALMEVEQVQTGPAPAQTAKKKPASPKASGKQATKE